MKKFSICLMIGFFAFSFIAFAANSTERTTAIVEFDNTHNLRTLVQFGVDIDAVWPTYTRVYVNGQEFDKLLQNGFNIKWIRNQALEMFETLKEQTKDSSDPMDSYHTYEELTAELQSIADRNPDICSLFSAGQSVQARELWVMKISDNVGIEENEPEFKYISTMHGDEPIGTELLIYLINYLVDNYSTDPQVTHLINDTEIYIMPLMNPDGNAAGRRYNANGVDLNRSFPDRIYDPHNTIEGREPEIQSVMTFVGNHTPVMSANFHTGALVVNYPWDHGEQGWGYAASPDDDVFINISKAYSKHNTPMWSSGYFPNGITNGADWYPISGSMQDWNYVWEGCMEVTVELNNVKWPDPSELPILWEHNRTSILSYIEEVHKGVRGKVTNVRSGEPVFTTIMVQGRDMPFYTDPEVGDYHRPLLPGVYDLYFEAEGYLPLSVENITVDDGYATCVDVQMEPRVLLGG